MTLMNRLKENYAWNRSRREDERRTRLPFKKELRKHYQLYLVIQKRLYY